MESSMKVVRSLLLNILFVVACYQSIQANEFCAEECCDEDYGVGLRASYLYWGVQEDGLGFAIEGLNVLNGNRSNSRVRTHDPKWNSGFRIEGFASQCECPIAFSAGWTYFDAISRESALGEVRNGSPNLGVTTVSGYANQANPFLWATAARSRFNIKMNEFVADAAYPICCSSCFSCLPYAGIIGARIKQKQNIVYLGVPLTFNGEAITAFIDNARKSRFSGIGPRFGLGLDWHFCNGFNLIANGNVAYLFGRFDTKNNVLAIGTIDGSLLNVNASNLFANVRERVSRGRPMASGMLGVEWRNQLGCTAELSLSLAYEFQYWWQQWHNVSNVLNTLITSEGQWGDLSMHGIAVSACLAF